MQVRFQFVYKIEVFHMQQRTWRGKRASDQSTKK